MRTYPLFILIADDSDDDRVLFSRAVRALPEFRVAGLTADGLETVMYLRGFASYGNRAKYPFPDLLLLDYQMPGYNGLEVLAEVRKLAKRPTAILWSNTIDRIDQGFAYRLGAALVCAKPVLSDDIRKTLKAAEERHLFSNAAAPWMPQQDSRIGGSAPMNMLAPAQSDL